MSDQRLNEIKQRLQALNPTVLDVQDESHLHVGHSEKPPGPSHFFIEIHSPSFDGLSRLEQHRRVYALLADWIPSPIHALRLKTQVA